MSLALEWMSRRVGGEAGEENERRATRHRAVVRYC